MPEKKLRLETLLTILDSIAPRSLAESWDNVGLMVGDPDQTVTGILVALDPTEEVIRDALSLHLNTIITHHPLLFHPLKKIDRRTPLGRMLTTALAHDLAIVACHTNLDVTASGSVSDAMAARLSLENTRPLAGRESPAAAAGTGLGRIGTLSAPMPAEQFLTRLFSALDCRGLHIAGPLPEMIRTVALCGGSGSELAEAARTSGADLYITGEVKHSTARWAEATGFCVIDAGHYATEQLVVPALATRLATACAAAGRPAVIKTCQSQRSPRQWVVLHENKPLFC
jgi:dinuclear metal center YbgI/SA1388 family protein